MSVAHTLVSLKKGVSDTQLQSPLKLLKVYSTHACHQGIQSVFTLLWENTKVRHRSKSVEYNV